MINGIRDLIFTVLSLWFKLLGPIVSTWHIDISDLCVDTAFGWLEIAQLLQKSTPNLDVQLIKRRSVIDISVI